MLEKNYTPIAWTTQMEQFMNGLDEFKARYTSQLKEFKETHDDLYEKMDNHEHRITVLETKNDTRGNHQDV